MIGKEEGGGYSENVSKKPANTSKNYSHDNFRYGMSNKGVMGDRMLPFAM